METPVPRRLQVWSTSLYTFERRKGTNESAGGNRWFDQKQEHCLSVEQLELILNSSSRNISRSVVSSCAMAACKDGRMRYEIYI